MFNLLSFDWSRKSVGIFDRFLNELTPYFSSSLHYLQWEYESFAVVSFSGGNIEKITFINWVWEKIPSIKLSFLNPANFDSFYELKPISFYLEVPFFLHIYIYIYIYLWYIYIYIYLWYILYIFIYLYCIYILVSIYLFIQFMHKHISMHKHIFLLKNDVYASSDLIRIRNAGLHQDINSKPIKANISFLEFPFK